MGAKIKEVLRNAIESLRKANIATADLDALVILKSLLQKDEVFILTHPEYELSKAQEKRFFDLIRKRCTYYPVAYITSKKEFYGFEFFVDERVLIPRPETEFVVDAVLEIAGKRKIDVVDVGTGSGCIAITLSKLLKTCVIATDISIDALEVASLNARRLKADVEFVACPCLDAVCGKFDVVVSNPPYIAADEFESLAPDVKREPKIALVCEDAMGVVECIHKGARKMANWLVLEISPQIAAAVRQLDGFVKTIRDYSSNERVALFRFGT